MPYALYPGERIEKGVRRIAIESLDAAIEQCQQANQANEAGASPAADEAVHEVRKACKRLRALLRFVRPGLGKDFAVEDKAIRDAARRLSGFRDAHVLQQTCDRLSSQASAALDPPVNPTPHSEPPTAVLTALRRVADQLAKIRKRASKWTVRHGRRSAADGTAQVYRDGRRALQACRRVADDDSLNPDHDTAWHEWRKQVKYHTYQCRLFSPLHPAVVGYHDPFNELGRTLGEEHDLSVLLARIAAGDPPTRPINDDGQLYQAALIHRAALREAALDLGADLYRCRPRRIRALVQQLLSLC